MGFTLYTAATCNGALSGCCLQPQHGCSTPRACDAWRSEVMSVERQVGRWVARMLTDKVGVQQLRCDSGEPAHDVEPHLLLTALNCAKANAAHMH